MPQYRLLDLLALLARLSKNLGDVHSMLMPGRMQLACDKQRNRDIGSRGTQEIPANEFRHVFIHYRMKHENGSSTSGSTSQG
jgi:hypothetical protein